MAWTTPRTWVTAEVVTASHMNTHVRDNTAYLKDSPRFDGTPTVPVSLKWIDDVDASGELLAKVFDNGDGVVDLRDGTGTLRFRLRFVQADATLRVQAPLRVDNDLEVIGAATAGGHTVPVQAHGSYTGDGTADRTISLPFTPELVIVHAEDLVNAPVAGFVLSTVRGLYFNSDTNSMINTINFKIVSGGFTVSGGILNTDTEVHNYTALKAS